MSLVDQTKTEQDTQRPTTDTAEGSERTNPCVLQDQQVAPSRASPHTGRPSPGRTPMNQEPGRPPTPARGALGHPITSRIQQIARGRSRAGKRETETRTRSSLMRPIAQTRQGPQTRGPQRTRRLQRDLRLRESRPPRISSHPPQTPTFHPPAPTYAHQPAITPTNTGSSAKATASISTHAGTSAGTPRQLRHIGSSTLHESRPVPPGSGTAHPPQGREAPGLKAQSS